MNYNGKLNLILGPMFSGKTTELNLRYRRYKIGGKKCLMVKYKGDNRYDNMNVVTHDNISTPAVVCNLLKDIDNIVEEYQVVCIDEIQFYKDAPIYCEKWANMGIIVEVCGLNGTFNRKPFPVVSELIAMAENILKINAVCKETGEDAAFSTLLSDNTDDSVEVIGGSDMYKATDRRTYFSFENKKRRI